MNPQELHLIDLALELIVYWDPARKDGSNSKVRLLKNAVYECCRCFHGDEVWGEPYHTKMVENAFERLSNILQECGTHLRPRRIRND
tara:strand:- start:20344 stop:20604 length:261 start_codon:yes stop_codon:yes gene_type:complete